jgi:putative Flp pilus-assembly TadE/G-like protein
VIARLRDDRGSVIPLILGCWLLVMLVAAGYVAATDAFAKRVDLQDVCDGAAIAAANSVDFAGGRDVGAAQSSGFLPLGDVQVAVDAYLARDPWRSPIRLTASLNEDRTEVTVSCRRRSKIAFGWLFGKPDGVVATVSSSARSSVAGR